MDITEFQKVNESRAKRWHGEGDWSLLEWAGAMCGEAGEAANVAKKLRRLELLLPNKEVGLDKKDEEILKGKLACEIADTIIYGLIILSRLDYDASLILASVYNRKSVEYGFPERAPE